MTTGRIDASMTNRMADTCTDAPKPLGEAAPDDVRAFESVLQRVGEEGARNGQNGPNDAPRSLLTENDPNRSLLSADDRERPNRANLSNLSTEKDPAGASLLSARESAEGMKEKTTPTPETNLKSVPSEKGEMSASASDEPPGADASDAERFLASLFRQAVPQAGGGSTPDALSILNAQAADGAAAPRKLETVRFEALAEQILVSSRDAGEAEVRIRLRDGVLPDTEIRLTRELSGRLVVRVVTGDPQTFQTLVSARNDLADALSATESRGVAVFVDRNGPDDDAAGRRSRGLADEDGQDDDNVARPRSLF